MVSFVFQLNTQHTHPVISVLLRQETATWGGCDLGNSGVWAPGLRVGGPSTPPFGARGRSSVRNGTRLGDLKNKQSTHTQEHTELRSKPTDALHQYVSLYNHKNKHLAPTYSLSLRYLAHSLSFSLALRFLHGIHSTSFAYQLSSSSSASSAPASAPPAAPFSAFFASLAACGDTEKNLKKSTLVREPAEAFEASCERETHYRRKRDL